MVIIGKEYDIAATGRYYGRGKYTGQERIIPWPGNPITVYEFTDLEEGQDLPYDRCWFLLEDIKSLYGRNRSH